MPFLPKLWRPKGSFSSQAMLSSIYVCQVTFDPRWLNNSLATDQPALAINTPTTRVTVPRICSALQPAKDSGCLGNWWVSVMISQSTVWTVLHDVNLYISFLTPHHLASFWIFRGKGLKTLENLHLTWPSSNQTAAKISTCQWWHCHPTWEP